MKAYKCDICGLLFDGSSSDNIGNVVLRDYDEGEGPYKRKFILHIQPGTGKSDLCDSCKMSIAKEALP